MVIGINTRDQLNEEDEIQRRLLQISTEFCCWLKNLPGEDREVNDTDPETLW